MILPKGVTVYVKGKKFKGGQECPDKFGPEALKKPPKKKAAAKKEDE